MTPAASQNTTKFTHAEFKRGFLVIVVEMAQITPPVGFNLFVLQSMTGHNIFRLGLWALPFFLLMAVMVVALFLVPDIALWLPRQMLDG